MRHLPMDLPAEMHRWVENSDSAQPGRSDIVVARGPLVIMAHGLLAIEAEIRDTFWIDQQRAGQPYCIAGGRGVAALVAAALTRLNKAAGSVL